jgi:hypothetical protein
MIKETLTIHAYKMNIANVETTTTTYLEWPLEAPKSCTRKAEHKMGTTTNTIMNATTYTQMQTFLIIYLAGMK